jgi:hypothetical protein
LDLPARECRDIAVIPLLYSGYSADKALLFGIGIAAFDKQRLLLEMSGLPKY